MAGAGVVEIMNRKTRAKAVIAWLQRHSFLFAVTSIAVSTPIFYLGRDHFPRNQWALLYLPIIVLVASSGGVRPALLAAVLAFFAGNFFFLEPYHTLFVTDPKDWLSLFVFLVVGSAMGLQTGRMRARESQALDREREAVLLNELQAAASQADALREADRLKSAFISSVSHELKTPLASVTATVTGLLENDLEWNAENVRAELVSVDDDLNRLNDSIGSLLDLSRLEADAWLPQKDWYEFGEILGTALSRIPERQKDRIRLSVPGDLPPIHADFAQWARVLRNLLENALTYSGPDRPPVWVGVTAGEGELRIWVEDSGPGISSEEKARVFEKFYRGKASAAAPSGTGLGLAISREIVRFHGGRIFVEDVEPHGARFVVTLPIERTEEASG